MNKEPSLKSHLKVKHGLYQVGGGWTKETRKRMALSQGWLSPEGVLYYCNEEGHEGLAQKIMDTLKISIDSRMCQKGNMRQMGWIKLHYPEGFIVYDPATPYPTEKQQKFILAYEDKIGYDLRAALETRQRNNKQQEEQRANWELPF